MTSPNTIIADMQAEIDALRKERDELLSTMELIARILPRTSVSRTLILDCANKAIASVKGGA